MMVGRHAARICLLLTLTVVAGACGSGGGKGGTGGSIAMAGAGGTSGSHGAAGGAGGSVVGGTSGTSGASGAGGEAVTCTSNASGCQCHQGAPLWQSIACTTSSVATGAGDVGVCCQDFLCSCTAYICRYDSGLDFCSCAPSYTVTGIVNGPVVTACPLPTGNVKCCFQAALNNCTCALGDCVSPLDEVPSCSLADVTVCQNSAARVSICASGNGGSGTGGGSGGSSGGAGAGTGGSGGGNGGAAGHAGNGSGGTGVGGAGGQPSGGMSGHAGAIAGTGGSSAGASGHAGANVDAGAADAHDAATCGFDGGCSRAKGAQCSADGECSSDHCVDGFCCDSACSGACVNCGIAGSEGTCLSIVHGTDFRGCAGASTCGPDGTCKAAEGQSCTAASQCALGACPASVCCADSTCDRAYGWSHLTDLVNNYTTIAMATGPAGQIALFGDLTGCVDADPGPPVQTVCPPTSSHATILTVLDRDGRYLWSRMVAGASGVGGRTVAFVPGGVVITDSFGGSINFDPSNPAATLTGPGSQSVYLSRFDLDGKWTWGRAWGAQGVTFLNTAVGTDGSFAIVGHWVGTLDFDPGAGAASETTATNITANFLLKLASDGTHAWHKVIPTPNVDAVAVADDGSIAIGGRFAQATDFDPGPGTTTVTPTGGRLPWDFISVFDGAGTFQWVRVFGTSSQLGNDAVNVAALDGGGWAVAGSFEGVQADFDPLGAHDYISSHWTATHQPDEDIFLTYVTSTGGYVKTFTTGSTSDDYFGSLQRRKGGGVWLSARFYGSADLDPGTGTTTATGPVLLEIGSQMQYLWSATPTAYVPFAASPADNSVLLLTPINAATDFDPGPGTDILQPAPPALGAVVLTKFWP